MSPFEELYGRKCNIPINWDNLVEWITLGPDMLTEMELEIENIKQNLKVAQDRKNFLLKSQQEMCV
jgi:hypothetical protein